MAGYLYDDISHYRAPVVPENGFLYDNINTQSSISGLEYLGGKFISGIESIFKGAENLIKGGFYQLTGNTYAAEKLYATNDPQARSKRLDQQYKANGFMSFMGSVAEGIGQVAPTVALNLIPVVGPTMGTALSFAGHTGMAVGDAYAKTGELGWREYIYGGTMGILESAMEVVGGKVGGWIGGSKLGTSAVNLGKGATKGLTNAAAKSGRLALARAAGQIVKGGATEFTEEFIEAYAEVGLQRVLDIDPNASVTLGEALYAGAVGFASGGVMSGAASVINTPAMKNVGKRVMNAGEVDVTISAATEIASAFKSSSNHEAEVLKILQDNLKLWELTADKTGGQAQMILGNIELAMNVVATTAEQQGTVQKVIADPEKFLPYAKALFGEDVTLDDLKDADSRIVRFFAASNWATGEGDALAIRAKQQMFRTAVEQDRTGTPMQDLKMGTYTGFDGNEQVMRAEDGDLVFVAKNKNGSYTVMKGPTMDDLVAYGEQGPAQYGADGDVSAALLDEQQVTRTLARVIFDAGENVKQRAEAQTKLSLENGESIIEISDDSELAQLLKANADKNPHEIIKSYLVTHFGGQTFTLSDGRQAIMDKRDADKLSVHTDKRSVAQVSGLREMVERAQYDHSAYNVEHKKFKDFHYYVAKIRYGKKEYEIWLNIGTAKNNGTNHIYDIRDKKEEAPTQKDVSRPEGNAIRSASPTDSIPENGQKVKSEDKKYSLDEEAQNGTETGTESESAADGGKAEENAAESENGGEGGKEAPKAHTLSSAAKRVRERLIDSYGAEVQDRARKLYGKKVDQLSADRRIAIYEAIESGQNVDKDTLAAACYFIAKRSGLYLYFGQDLNEVIGEEAEGEGEKKAKPHKNGLHKVWDAGNARLVAIDGNAKGLRKAMVHEVFHDIASTKAGLKLLFKVLDVASVARLYETAKLYGDYYATVKGDRGVISFEQFFTDGKYDKESRKSVLEAIDAYQQKFEAEIGRNVIFEEIAAKMVEGRLDSKRFMKMAKDTGTKGLILRSLRRMISYLRAKKEAKPMLLEAIRFENLYLDAIKQRGEYEANGDAQYSLLYAPRLANNAREKLLTRETSLTEDELELAIEHTAHMVEIMKKYEHLLPEDKIGATLVKNGSYDRSVENTTICVRTLAYNSFVDMVSEKIGRPLSQRESFLVSQKLYEIAKEPQCLYCYVSLDRKAYNEMLLRYITERDRAVQAFKDAGSPEVTRSSQLYLDYLHGRKDTPDQWKRYSAWMRMAKAGETMLSPEEIATEARRVGLAGGTESQRAQVADMLKYAQSASWAKKQTAYAAYKGDILTLGPKVIKDLNKHYGLRWYSFSDYSAAFIVENMQQITDAAVMGLKGLAYTKDTDFARIFAPTGMNINISVYAKYEGGRYVIDEKQSANLEEAIALREQYPNVGIVVVASDRQGVEWALAQEWSDVVIPFHIVRTGKDVADFYKWEVFNAEQNDTVESDDLWQAYVDSVTAPGASENARKKVSKMVYPSEHQNSRETYLRLCKERGLKPRFGSFLSNENYMKLVSETRQSEAETKPLSPNFDVEAAEQSFGKFVEKGGYFEGWYNDGIDVEAEAEIVAADVRAGKQANEVDYGRQDLDADALMKGRRATREHGADTHYSLDMDLDSEGNVLTDRQKEYFRDSKARDAKGKLLVLFHGTTANFNVFKKGDIGFHFGTKAAARGRVGFGKNVDMKKVYLNITNPIVFEEDLGSWDADYRLTQELFERGVLNREEAEQVLLSDNKLYKRTTEKANQKLRELLLQKGYDGIVYQNTFETKKATTSYIAFQSNQAKLVENEIPTGNPDTRYSLDFEYLSEDEHELNPPSTSEGEKQKNIAKHTRAKSYKRMEVAEVLGLMFSSEHFGEKGSVLSMAGNDEKRITDYLWRQMNKTDEKDFDKVSELVADFMIRHTLVQEALLTPSDEIRFENARQAISTLKRFKGKIRISEQARAELVYRFGGKTGRKKGYGEKLADYWNQKDGNGMSLEAAAEAIETEIRAEGGYCSIVADTEQDTVYNLVNYHAQVLSDLEDYRTFMQKTAMSKESEADRAAFRAEIKEKILDALHDKGKESKLRKIVRAYESTESRLRDKLYEVNKKYEGAVKKQYTAADAVFLAREVGEMVTKRKYLGADELISPEMQSVGEILASIATPRKVKEKQARKAMKLLAQWYTPQNVDGDSAVEAEGSIQEAAHGSLYHPQIKEKMEKIAAGDENAQLTYEEVRDLAQVLGAVRHVIQNYGMVQLNGKRVKLNEAAGKGASVLSEYIAYQKEGDGKERGFFSELFHNAGKAVGKKLKQNFLYRVMTPAQVIRSLEFYDEDGVMTKAYADVQDGMAGSGSDYADMMRPVIEFFDSHKKYEKRLAKEYISYEGEEMTVGQAISLYLTTKREQAALGFAEAGFRYMGKDGEVRQGKARDAEAIRNEIGAALSADDKAYIKVIEGVFERAKELKVQTDLDIFAYTNVEDGYYFPIARDRMEIARKVSDLRATLRDMAVVGNKSFNKSTVKGAKNTLFIDDVTLVTEAHALGVAQYANLYTPLSSWDRLWNKKVDNGKGEMVTLRRLMGDSLWTAEGKRDTADAYFSQLFADIQGVRAEKRVGDGIYAAVRSTYVSAALGFNLSSILKQLGSFPSACVYLSAVDLAKGLGMNLKADRAEMWKYSKVANGRMFDRGRFVEQGANTSKETMTKRVREFGEMTMAGVEGMDNWVVGRLWNACQQNIARTKGFEIGSEQNKIEAGKLLDTVINETQSTSTADTRSAMQRGGFVAQTLSMFTSDAVKQVSYLFEGIARLQAAKLRRKMGKGSDADVKAAKKFFARSLASFAASTALVVAIAQLIKWLLGREREEDESLAEDIGQEALGQVLGIVPLVGDLYDKFANNYDVGSFVFDNVNELADGTISLFDAFGKLVSGETVSKQDFLKPLRTVAYKVSEFYGLPMRNTYNYLTGVVKKISPETGYDINALFEKPSYTADIAKAIERGDTELAQYILELSIKERLGKGEYDSAVAAELLYFANTGEDVTPDKIPGTVDGVTVTAAQHKQMQSIYNKAGKAMGQMIQSDAYLSLSDEEKLDAINRTYRTYLNYAKAEVMGTKDGKRTAAVWVSPLLSGESNAILARIAAMEDTKTATRSQQVTAYLNSLDLENDERYLLLFAAGYRSATVLKKVRGIVAASDISDEDKALFEAQYFEDEKKSSKK